MEEIMHQKEEISKEKVTFTQKAPPSYLKSLKILGIIDQKAFSKGEYLMQLYEDSIPARRNFDSYRSNFNFHHQFQFSNRHNYLSKADRAYEKWRKIIKKAHPIHRDLLIRLSSETFPHFSALEKKLLQKALEAL